VQNCVVWHVKRKNPLKCLTCGWVKEKKAYINENFCVFFTHLSRSPPWGDLHKILHDGSPRWRHQPCQILSQSDQGFRFCRGANFWLSHRKEKSPLTQGLDYRSACDEITDSGHVMPKSVSHQQCDKKKAMKKADKSKWIKMQKKWERTFGAATRMVKANTLWRSLLWQQCFILYYFWLENERLKICREMLLSALCLEEWSVCMWLMISLDGLHMNTSKRLVPTISRHIETVKMWELVQKFLLRLTEVAIWLGPTAKPTLVKKLMNP